MSSRLDRFLDDEKLNELAEADWPVILPRIIKYAKAKVKKFQALGIPSLDPEDLVHEAILRAFSARREWNQERYPDVGSFLKSIISSLCSHELSHYKRFRHYRFGAFEEATQDPLEAEASQVEPVASRSPNPEEVIVQEQRAKEIIEKISQLQEDDEEVQMVLLCAEEGISKPRDIAEQTGYEIKRVYNILRRLRRNLEKLRLGS